MVKKLLARNGAVAHVREPVLIFAIYLIYLGLAKGVVDRDVALAHAGKVIGFERSLGFFWEPSWQEWVLGGGKWTAYLANYVYIFTYMPLILFTAFVVYIVNRDKYYYYRNIIFLSMAFAFTVFVLFPLAPPSQTSGYGFVDTITVYGPQAYGEKTSASSFYNTVAAMPSMHFAWTLTFGIMFFRTGPRWLKVAGVLYPTATLFGITITGMHFLLDAIAGAALALIVYAVYETVFLRHNVVARAVATIRSPKRRPAMAVNGAGTGPAGTRGLFAASYKETRAAESKPRENRDD